MKCAFPSAKIAASFETTKRNMLKSVKGLEKVVQVPGVDGAGS